MADGTQRRPRKGARAHAGRHEANLRISATDTDPEGNQFELVVCGCDQGAEARLYHPWVVRAAADHPDNLRAAARSLPNGHFPATLLAAAHNMVAGGHLPVVPPGWLG